MKRPRKVSKVYSVNHSQLRRIEQKINPPKAETAMERIKADFKQLCAN